MKSLLEELLKSPDNPETQLVAHRELKGNVSLFFEIALVVSDLGMPPVDAITDACMEVIAEASDAFCDENTYLLLSKVMLGKRVDDALEWLCATGFIAKYFPELEATRHLSQEPGRHHKDVWEHTKLVVKQAVPDEAIRWAALFHDIGKVPTRRFKRNAVTFHGHDEVGARMFDKICKRMFFPPEIRRTIRFLIKHHLRSAQYDEGWTSAAVRRFYNEIGDELSNLLALSRADITSKRPGRRKELLYKIAALSERIDQLKKKTQ